MFESQIPGNLRIFRVIFEYLVKQHTEITIKALYLEYLHRASRQTIPKITSKNLAFLYNIEFYSRILSRMSRTEENATLYVLTGYNFISDFNGPNRCYSRFISFNHSRHFHRIISANNENRPRVKK